MQGRVQVPLGDASSSGAGPQQCFTARAPADLGWHKSGSGRGEGRREGGTGRGGGGDVPAQGGVFGVGLWPLGSIQASTPELLSILGSAPAMHQV